MTAFSSARSGVGPYDRWTDFYGTILREAVLSADNQILVAAANFLAAGDSIVIGAAHDSPVTKTIDSIAGTVITLTANVGADFAVNSPVTALPTSSSAPTGAAGGDLSGTYPNPSVSSDSHTHTDATVPPASIGAATDDHDHDAAYDATGTAAAAVSAHTGDTSDAHDASAISILDTANDFTATDVEGALAELQSDAEAHLADTSDAHDASAISIADAGTYFTATDVEAALQELAAIDPLAGEVSTINFIIDGGGATITTGVKGDLVVDFACTIVAWTALADQSGSIAVDIWKDTYANFPPTVADTITGAEKPTITTATKGQDTSLASGSGWAVSAGDVLRFNVDSVTTCQRVTVALKVTRT